MGVEMIHDLEKTIVNLLYMKHDCLEGSDTDRTLDKAVELLKAQDEVITALLKVGYPHGYEQEEPWIVDYLNRITDVIRKAVRLKNGNQNKN